MYIKSVGFVVLSAAKSYYKEINFLLDGQTWESYDQHQATILLANLAHGGDCNW